MAPLLQASRQNDFALLAGIGGECAGAVTLLEFGQTPGPPAEANTVRSRDDAERNYALRLPESLKKTAKGIAAADDTSMNQFFVVVISGKISAMEAANIFQKRAALGADRDGATMRRLIRDYFARQIQ